jgi:peptidyl-prolyl cis-trans isomerase B (cyclophilin B)
MGKIICALLLILCTILPLAGCEKDEEIPLGEPGETIMVQIEMENGGIIKLELYPEHAPITVKNFVDLVNDGFYDGLIFHRVIKNFMIQGGDPEGTGMGGSKKTIKGEFAANGVNNPIKHERGVISMARTQAPNSASSQFFICHKDAPHLDGSYAAFGRVIEGIEVVDEIANVVTGKNDRPREDVVIKSIRVIEE